MTTALQILEDTLVEYPKHPARGALFSPISGCACLLGQIGLSGGLGRPGRNRIDYPFIDDRGPMTGAVKFLAQAIKIIDPQAPGSGDQSTVYYFNDATLAHTQPPYSEEDIEPLMVAVRVAIQLAKDDAKRLKLVRQLEEAIVKPVTDVTFTATPSIVKKSQVNRTTDGFKEGDRVVTRSGSSDIPANRHGTVGRVFRDESYFLWIDGEEYDAGDEGTPLGAETKLVAEKFAVGDRVRYYEKWHNAPGVLVATPGMGHPKQYKAADAQQYIIETDDKTWAGGAGCFYVPTQTALTRA